MFGFWEALLAVLLVILLYKLVDYAVRLPTLGGFSDKYVLITGCDSGFGHEAAKLLDSKGCHVIAACLTEKGETDLRKVCSSCLKTVALDVTNHESVTKAYEFVKGILQNGQGLWGLINNAGIIAPYGPFYWLHIEDYKKIFFVNTLGLIAVTTTFLPLIKMAKGRIINTSSYLGRFAAPILTEYVVSKYMVEAFSDGIRRQLMGSGVSVHIVEPGSHRTRLTASDNEAMAPTWRIWERAGAETKQLNKEEFERYIQRMQAALNFIPFGDPINVAKAYEHAVLAKFPRARYTVGADAKIFVFLQMLPEWLSDTIAAIIYKDFLCLKC